MSDIFREIDEELRRENFQQLWTRYGKYVVALAVLVVVATAAFAAWREYQLHQREAEGVRYAAALDLARQGKAGEAADAFAAIASTAGAGRVPLAELEEAAAKAKAGDVDGAVAIYDRLAADTGIEPAFRDSAILLSARYGLDKDPGAVVTQLQPLVDAANPWHGLALELTGLAELQSGDKAKARADFTTLAKDSAVTQGVRQRAGEMAEAIGP